MDLTHRQLGHVEILSLRGHVRAPESIKLTECINQLFDEGRFCLVLDLEDVESIGSSGLYVLIQAYKRVQTQKVTSGGQGDIRIIHVGPRIKQILDLTGLTSLLHICDDLAEAMDSLSGCREATITDNRRLSAGYTNY